jgi:hypothetical protein
MPSTAARADFHQAVDQFSDWRWRLNNLYWITDKGGNRVRFQMNWAQESLFGGMHYLSLILKARQLGFTTFIQIFMLDACLFNSNVRAGTIAHTLDDAKIIFRDKIKYPYDNLPDGLKAAIPAQKDTANELLLGNNSSIRVGTSLRSGTLQYLHISEYGKICAKFPEKAREVRTGALNTVQAGQIVFIESTAEGQEGHFYDLCQTAQARQRMGTKLSPLDFKFSFYPWWKDPGYSIDPDGVAIPEPYQRYFEKLAVPLSDGQKAWYVKKAETQQGDMKREYPSTPEEAFEASIEGAYYAEQLAKAELDGRIGAHRYVPGFPVHTAWDIGTGDYTAIWFFQVLHGKIGLVGYYQNTGEGVPFYVAKLREMKERRGWTYGEHWYPHDAEVQEWGSGRTRVEQLIEAKLKPRIVRHHHVDDGINAAREIFGKCWFDEEECADGLKALRNYRKDWDEEHAIWKDRPRHDWASHGADAFRYLAMAYRELRPAPEPPPKPKHPYEGKDGMIIGNVSITEMIRRAERRAERD